MTEKLIVSDITLVTKDRFNELSANLDDDYVYFRVADNFELSQPVGVHLLIHTKYSCGTQHSLFAKMPRMGSNVR